MKALTTLNDLMTPEEAAEFLCSSVKSLAKYRSTGENNIPYRKLGRKVLYSRADLTAYMNSDRHSFNKIKG